MSTKISKSRHKKTPVSPFNSVNQGYITYVLIAVVLFGFLLAMGFTNDVNPPYDGTTYTLATPTPYGNYKSLELHTLQFVSQKPTPPVVIPSIPKTNFCTDYSKKGGLESIISGYSPGQGQAVSSGGQVKVWVSDENPPCVGTGEQIDSTGSVTVPGNHTELFSNGYLWEPALYIGTLSGNGGQPHFPDIIKGKFNNGPKSGSDCSNKTHQINGPAIDPIQSNGLHAEDNSYTAEYIWNINASLGLAPGTYPAEFIIHDGDDDQGGYCVSITIQ